MDKTDASSKLRRLQEQLTRYQKKYNELAKQSPTRWWHDEHFDNQLKLFENMIAETIKQIDDLKKEK